MKQCHDTPSPAPARFTRDLYLLSAVFFFVFAGAGAQQAYLVPYLRQVTPWSRVECSIVIGSVYLGMLMFRVLALRWFPGWSDRRFTIIGSFAYLGFTLAMAAIPWVGSYAFAVGAAFTWGAGAAMMWLGTSMQILHLSDQAGGRHGTGMGILYTSTHAGWLTGALCLGILYRSLDTEHVFLLYLAAAGSTALGNALVLLLPATGSPLRSPPTLKTFLEICRKQRALIAGVLQFLSALAYGLILGTFTYYVEKTYGADWIWITVSLYPATRMVLSFGGGVLTDRFGQAPVLFGGFLAGAIGLLATVCIHSPLSAAFTTLSLGLLNSTVPVSASAIVGKAADRARRPLVYSVVFAWRDLGIISAAVGSNLLGKSIRMNTVFVIFAGVFTACAFLAVLLHRYEQQRL